MTGLAFVSTVGWLITVVLLMRTRVLLTGATTRAWQYYEALTRLQHQIMRDVDQAVSDLPHADSDDVERVEEWLADQTGGGSE